MLIQNGTVIDREAGFNGPLDVAVRGNRIAVVEPNIPADTAAQVIDASGQIVTPGLVDLHTHVYHGATFWGIRVDPVAARSGVTTWLDAGSAGAYTLPGFREFIVGRSQARVYALLNIAAIGLVAPTGELANLEHCDVDLCCRLAAMYRDIVVGIKVRIDAANVGTNGVEPLRRAVESAERCGLPLMVHVAIGPPEIEAVLALLRPGDILTHCFTGHTMRIVDDGGNLLDAARAARERGVVMDIGHGAGSFSFRSAEAMLGAGFAPDVISSDIHQRSILGPLYDLPTCLSKFLALGMSLPDVIHAATARPAAILGLAGDVGTLRPGALADIALFTVQKGVFPFYDVELQVREGRELLTNTCTILDGQIMQPPPEDPPAPWIALDMVQHILRERGHTAEDLRKFEC